MHRLTPDQKRVIAERAAAGVPSRQIAREIGRAHRTVHDHVEALRRRPPKARCRSGRQLSLGEREEISRGLVAGESLRSIAAGLGRPASRVCREVRRNGGRRRYRAARAEDRAWARASASNSFGTVMLTLAMRTPYTESPSQAGQHGAYEREAIAMR